MADESSISHLSDIQVTTNAEPAAVEQKSTESKPEVTTEPAKTETVTEVAPAVEPAKVDSAVDTKPEPAKTEIQQPVADDKENQRARELIEARLRADRAEAEVKKLQPAAKPLGDRPTHPTLEKFNTLEDYQKACVDYDKAVDEWNDRRIETASEAKAKERIDATERARVADQERVAVLAKEEASRAKHPDYNNVVEIVKPLVQNSPLFRDFIAKNPMGTEVAYELGKNAALLEQISRLNVWEAGEMLINMANRLKNPPAAVKPTNAPEPIKTVGTNEVVSKKLADLPMEDYFAARRAQEIKARHLN